MKDSLTEEEKKVLELSKKIDIESNGSPSAKLEQPTIDEQNLTTEPTEEEISLLKKSIEEEEKYAEKPLQAGALGAARGVSFGISDQILEKTGIVDKETLRGLEEYNKEASIGGEIAGTLAGAAATGGTSIPAKILGAGVGTAAKIGKGVEKASELALEKAIQLTGNPAVAKSIIAKTLSKTAGSAAEGSLYGVGQLISEDALGTKELNAENLLAAAGTGAILGGVAAGALGSIETIAPLMKKGGEVVYNKVKIDTDPIKASLEYAGLTPKQQSKWMLNYKSRTEELPKFYKDEVGLSALTSYKTATEKVRNVIDDAGKNIDTLLTKMDDIGKEFPTIYLTKEEANTIMAKNLDDRFISKFKTPRAQRELKEIINLRNDYLERAKTEEGRFTAKDIQGMKKELDTFINYDKLNKNLGLNQQADKSTRFILKDIIDTIADRASSIAKTPETQNLVGQLKKENRRYEIAANLYPSMFDKLNKEKMINTWDLVKGGALIGVLKDVGAVAAAVIKFNESDLARKLKIMMNVEQTNKNIEKAVQSSTKSIFEKVPVVAKPTSINILLETAYGRKDFKGKAPEDKLQAFKNVQDNIQKIKTDPYFLQEALYKNTLRLSKHAPGTAEVLQTKLVQAVNFLDSKLPRDPRPQGALDIFRSKWQPSSIQLAKFERYVEAVEHPMQILKDFKSGSITPEQVEVLKNVYPDLHTRLKESVLSKLQEGKEELSYKKRLQIGLLLDIPADASLDKKTILQLQKAFLPEDKKAPIGNINNLETKDISTPIEKIQKR